MRAARLGMWGSVVLMAVVASVGTAPGVARAGSPAADSSSGNPPVTASRTTAPMVPIASLSIDVQRRAERHLAEQRGRGRAWEKARGLAQEALPMFQADTKTPTHYAIAVQAADGTDAGYIVVAVTPTDFPIPEAQEGGPDVLTLLEQARRSAGSFARVVRHGVGSYSAEGSLGDELARVGMLPMKPSGLSLALLDLPAERRAGHAFRSPGANEDRIPELGTTISAASYTSYADYKADHATDAIVGRMQSTRAAADAWRDERALAELPLLLEPFAARQLALLEGRGEAAVTISGTSVMVTRGRDAAGREVLHLVGGVEAAQDGEETRVDVHYDDGSQENLRFAGLRSPFLGLVPPLPSGKRLPVPTQGSNLPTPHPVTPVPALTYTPLPLPPPVANACTTDKGSPLVQLVGSPPHSILGCAPGHLRLRTWSEQFVGVDTAGLLTAGLPYEEIGSVSIVPADTGLYVIMLHPAGGGAAKELVVTTTVGTLDGVPVPGAAGQFMLAAAPVSLSPQRNALFRIEMTHDGHFAIYSPAASRYLVGYDTGSLALLRDTQPPGQQCEKTVYDETLFLPMCISTTGESWGHPEGNPTAAMRDVRKYDQIIGRRAPNTSPCYSGCAATAWTMMYGWADVRAGFAGDPFAANGSGLFRTGATRTGSNLAVAPEWFYPNHANSHNPNTDMLDADAAKMTMEIRGYLNNDGVAGCTDGGERYTLPQVMAQASQYYQGRALISLTADYDGALAPTTEGREKAKGVMTNKHRPVILGIGDLGSSNTHYPLGVGWGASTYQLWSITGGPISITHDYFVVYMGWGNRHLTQVGAATWFQGWLHPTTNKDG